MRNLFGAPDAVPDPTPDAALVDTTAKDNQVAAVPVVVPVPQPKAPTAPKAIVDKASAKPPPKFAAPPSDSPLYH